ncbi:hypothetical protein CAOG_04813 [Capsaspora owczarzaki ATCC 30864]|uniref:Uncharacterized protein n=1 Tax=Capsaspora owczarzaki (strain ATCC 30864) TaxID=595528 RepID=A0A0D2WQV6_CAPO3|nr:hypothetical protein CAOG_04813 [Capsaspora owczarzaki ATCC 30864]KJE94125.1 hypothetical protein CAOG_004813 [Capsaspora owczarzaki ATCC 30864]|eukprot:XP_004347564.1 hypothetical protein CAOG_04813 [Capsaspora owczarzaki ATCC 30864]
MAIAPTSQSSALRLAMAYYDDDDDDDDDNSNNNNTSNNNDSNRDSTTNDRSTGDGTTLDHAQQSEQSQPHQDHHHQDHHHHHRDDDQYGHSNAATPMDTAEQRPQRNQVVAQTESHRHDDDRDDDDDAADQVPANGPFLDTRGVVLPPIPTGPCDPALQRQIAAFIRIKQTNSGATFNQRLFASKAFRNPIIYEKLVQFCETDEYGSNLVLEAHRDRFQEDSLYEALAQQQQDFIAEKARQFHLQQQNISHVHHFGKRPGSSTATAVGASAAQTAAQQRAATSFVSAGTMQSSNTHSPQVRGKWDGPQQAPGPYIGGASATSSGAALNPAVAAAIAKITQNLPSSSQGRR